MANIFISWSGERSKKAAEALRDCIQSVIQAAEPWFSPDDIGKGKLWRGEIQAAIESIKLAVLVVTPDNKEKPWLLYEAGAFSAELDGEGAVMPYLVGLGTTDITSPLADLNVTRATKEDTLKMLKAIRSAVAPALSDRTVERAFEREWDDLDAKLKEAIALNTSVKSNSRTPDEKIDDILDIVRGLAREQVENAHAVQYQINVDPDRQQAARDRVEQIRQRNGNMSFEQLKKNLTIKAPALRERMVRNWIRHKQLTPAEGNDLLKLVTTNVIASEALAHEVLRHIGTAGKESLSLSEITAG